MIEFLVIALAVLLCIIGLILSSLAFSGTWMVLLAALITKFSIGFPNTGTVVAFTLLCIGTEAFEAMAGFLGVQKRGGSKWAGMAALVGGLIGTVIGSAIFPILGTLIGMLLGSFTLAFLTERHRLGHDGQAAHIARGAVWARLGIMLFKTGLTAAMSLWLLVGLIRLIFN